MNNQIKQKVLDNLIICESSKAEIEKMVNKIISANVSKDLEALNKLSIELRESLIINPVYRKKYSKEALKNPGKYILTEEEKKELFLMQLEINVIETIVSFKQEELKRARKIDLTMGSLFLMNSAMTALLLMAMTKTNVISKKQAWVLNVASFHFSIISLKTICGFSFSSIMLSFPIF